MKRLFPQISFLHLITWHLGWFGSRCDVCPGARLVETARVRRPESRYDRAFVETCASTISLMIVVEMIRIRIVGNIRGHLLDTPFAALQKASAGSYYDFAFLAVMAMVFLCGCYVARNRVNTLLGLRVAYFLWCVIIIAIYICHISILKYIGQPFTYQWLYYSGFLGSMEAKQAIWSNVSFTLLLVVLACVAIFAASFLVTRRLAAAFVGASGSGRVAAALLVLMFSYSAWSRSALHTLQLPYAKTANPILAFVGSFSKFNTPILYTYRADADISDFEPHGRVSRAVRAANAGRQKKPVKNVLFFVFESTPATLTSFYGGPYATTPQLDRRRSESLAFTNAYAHSPTTNTSLVSLLTATYPWIMAKFITEEHPDIRLDSISTELKRHGYRTGFFNSADLRFQSAGEFLKYQNFEVVRDDNSIPCSLPLNATSPKETFSSVALPYLDGIDDGCTADALVQWLRQEPERPFFAVMWTMMTHYPYPQPKERQPFPVKDQDLAKYLNCLRHGDEALGKILDELESSGLAASTLVVVLGDHGEAFGEHGFRGHGSSIYEQSVHIPLVLLNPQLFHGETNPSVGGLVDIAPTVMDLLGFAPGDPWQGRSFFDPNRPLRTYFFAPWSDLYFGYREKNLKYLFNATRNSVEVYDVQKDPGENESLLPSQNDVKEKVLERLSSWVQFQNRFLEHFGSGAD
jgi:lipoteichoic acid synthase